MVATTAHHPAADPAKLAAELRAEAERLKHAFDRAAAQWTHVTFEGPSAALFATRMEDRMHQVRSVLSRMGVAADELAGVKKHPAAHPKPAPDSTGGGTSGAHLPKQFRHYLPYVRAAAKKYHVSQAIILAVMDRETGDPHKIGLGGHNVRGDGGHGRGLMQIDDRSHGSWLAGHDGGMDPKSNIDYGTSIIAANLRQFHGNKHEALAAYNSGAGNVQRALRNGLSPDAYTANHNYGADVLRRAKWFTKKLAD
jgi:soluble lytic murein transglycosylase-like protein